MREQARQILESLPPIGVHGTTQSRWESILKTGLNQQINYFCIAKALATTHPKQALYEILHELSYPI